MALPAPKLDDRTFQQIVDEAKKLIPQYCPEWTDHNVSDPGVAFIELFAWMTEMLLYRTNQVPDAVYLKFLEMIGVELDTTRAAQVPVTFYLSAALDQPVQIAVGTQVATVRTETNPAIFFSTEPMGRGAGGHAIIQPPKMVGAYSLNNSQLVRGQADAWKRLDLTALQADSASEGGSNNASIPLFPAQPGTGDAFAIAFEEDLSHHVIALLVHVKGAQIPGLDPAGAPLVWEASYDSPRWQPCVVEYDYSHGFNESGPQIIVLRLPEMKKREVEGLPNLAAYWLQCRVVDKDRARARYPDPPEIRALSAEARGITITCRHCVLVEDEYLGRSDGTPGQSFQLLHVPILDLDPQEDSLLVETPDGEAQRWEYRNDFADSGPDDRHFTLDKLTGTITLGPMLIQPDGKVYRFGAVPPRDSDLRFSRYRYGGGSAGNVAPHAISVVKESLPFISQVSNPEPAQGGRDQQSLEDARLRAPHFLRTRMRAVTKDDHEYLAAQVAGVARACCVAPGAQPGQPGEPKPGQVFVYILPLTDDAGGFIEMNRLQLAGDLRNMVQQRLQSQALVGTQIEVRAPEYIQVAVDAKIRVAERADDGIIAQVQAQAEEALYRYLNPFTGGPDQAGWAFGRALHASEIYSLLQRIPHVEFVEGIRLNPINPLPGMAVGQNRLPLPRQAILISGRHNIVVQRVV